MLSSLQTLRYHLWKLSKFVFKPNLGGPTICVRECLNSGQKKEYVGMLLLTLSLAIITEAERSPKAPLRTIARFSFHIALCLLLKQEENMVTVYSFLHYHPVLITDASLICALVAFHNGQLFCYQFGLIIEWFCLICFSNFHFLDFTKAFLLCG